MRWVPTRMHWRCATVTGHAPPALAIMAKAPVPGLAKTRLVPLLGRTGAARAQRGFILRTVAIVRAAALGPVTLWCAPDERHRLFRLLRDRMGIATQPQPQGDLGLRMRVAMQAHFGRTPHLPWIVVGTDCPAMTPEHLQVMADALQRYTAVVLPAEDGGYVALGLARPCPAVFEGVDWSTPQVLAQTRERLKASDTTWLELPPLWDVDEPADWLRWQALQASS
jgi:rSAM/selenodomain-associated transferase 1